jgi:hypothetical protein
MSGKSVVLTLIRGAVSNLGQLADLSVAPERFNLRGKAFAERDAG